MNLKLISLTLFLLISTNSFAINFGKEGGGGSSVPSEGTADSYDVMKMARTELLMFFNRQSLAPVSAEIAKVVNGPQTIMDIIWNTPIYESFTKCKDANNTDVDGSIYAPVAGTICVYSGLMDRFLPEEGRKQLLALAAHEYSHLLGLNEAEAQLLQKAVYVNLTDSSLLYNDEAVYRAKVSFASARGAIINFRALSPIENVRWRHRCEVGERLQKYFGQLWERQISNETQFSIFDRDSAKTFVSYSLKIRALAVGACRFDDVHVDQSLYKSVYNSWFGSKTAIDSKYLGNLLTDKETADNILINRIENEGLFEAELLEIADYVESMFNYSFELSHLKYREKWPLR